MELQRKPLSVLSECWWACKEQHLDEMPNSQHPAFFPLPLSLQLKVCLLHYHRKAILLDQCRVLNRTRRSHCRRPLGEGGDCSVNHIVYRCLRSALCHSDRNTTTPAAPPSLTDWHKHTHVLLLTSKLCNVTLSQYGISKLCVCGSAQQNLTDD